MMFDDVLMLVSKNGLLGNYFSLLPLGLIYLVNISSLIMQDKLNNIWKKAD